MKNLNKYLSESLNNIWMYESLRIGLNDKPEPLIKPNWEELREIIWNRYREQGPGTKKQPIDFNDIDISNIWSFRGPNDTGLFEGTKYEYIDVSWWDTSNVTNMSNMFVNCNCLKELDLSNWNTSNVKDMSFIFVYCESLEKLDLSNWDTSKVESMHNMFAKCESLENLDLSSFNTKNLTHMAWIFNGCKSLRNIDGIDDWDISNIEDMRGSFNECQQQIIPDWYNEKS